MSLSSYVMLVAVLSAYGAPAQPVDVCTIPQNLPRYENRIVAVRGIVSVVAGKPYPNGYYFEELYRTDCPSAGAQGLTARIRLLSPEEEFLAHPPLGYRLDEESLRTMAREFNAHKKADGTVRAMVTVEGLLRRSTTATPGGESATTAARSRGPFGAELIVQAMKDPVFLDDGQAHKPKAKPPRR